MSRTARPAWPRCPLLALLLLPGLAVPGCAEERRTSTRDSEEPGCACDPDCPPGRCDVEVTLDAACPCSVKLVVDGEEVGELAPGQTWSSCRRTWPVGQQIKLEQAPGSRLRFHDPPSVCKEEVDHIRTTWACHP